MTSPRYDLVGTAEIATILGVSKQRVSQLTATGEFPVAVASLAMGMVWDKAEVVEYARTRNRLSGHAGHRTRSARSA